MEEEKDLMSFFNSDVPFEINLSPTIEEEDDNKDISEEKEISSEGVAEQEDQAEEDDTSQDESIDDESPNLYSSFASVLIDKGLLSSLDLQTTKIETIDDLTKVINLEIENKYKSFVTEKLGEQGYEALEKGVTLSEYQSYSNIVNALDKVTDDILETDLELAKNIILQDYIAQGFDQTRAQKLLKKTIDLGEETVIEDAKESLQSLKKIQDIKLDQLKAQRQKEYQEHIEMQEKIDNDLKNTIYSSKEIVKGLPVNKEIQDKVYKSITTIVNQTPDGVAENKLMKDRRENPINFDVKLYYLYEITNGFTDFSKLSVKASNKTISDLEKALKRNKFTDGENPAYLEDPESYGGIGSELYFGKK